MLRETLSRLFQSPEKEAPLMETTDVSDDSISMKKYRELQASRTPYYDPPYVIICKPTPAILGKMNGPNKPPPQLLSRRPFTRSY